MNKAESNLSRNCGVDAACSFDRLSKSAVYVPEEDGLHCCSLSCRSSRECVTVDEFKELQSIGAPVRHIDEVSVYQVGRILNKHFRSGEWGMSPRCGSVITCVLNGRSVYARVVKFVKVDGDECPGYAVVRWFSEPTYVNRLCPRVTLNGSNIYREVGTNVIKITRIDPSQVNVEVVPGRGVFYMIRDSGMDTRRS